MRLLPYVFGVAVLAAPQLASAAIVYNSVDVSPSAFNSGNETTNSSWDWVDPTANGPNAAQFTIPYTQTLDFVSLVLSADAPTDGGSVMVYLLPDNKGAPPYTTVPDASTSTQGANGVLATFTGGTLLGTIADSTLARNSSIVTVNSNVVLSAGSYWIGLATSLLPGQSDPINGTYGSGQWWWTQPDASVPVTLNFNSIGGPAPFAVGGTGNPGGYELVVSTPEPATVALLGGAMAGLGFMRRRRNRRRA